MADNGLTIVEKKTQKEREAEMIIQRCLQMLRSKFGFFLYAINIFEPVAVKEKIQPGTDGIHLFYNATEVIKYMKQSNSRELVKHLLHILLHGVFGDFEVAEEDKWKMLRWATMDMKVYQTMERLGYGENPDHIFNMAGPDYEPALYVKARKDKALAARVIQNHWDIRKDNHEHWAKSRKKKPGKTAKEQEINDVKFREEVALRWREVRGIMFPKKGMKGNGGSSFYVSLFGEAGITGETITVEDIAEKMRDNSYGMRAGERSWQAQAESGGSSDYREVLQRILHDGECMQEEDTIDQALYLYGLECYGDVPLIEPSEVSESRKMETLALAVDISGSCVNIVPTFLRETARMLRDVSSLVKKGKVYYFECDTEITYQKLYEDFKTAESELTVRQVSGGGGTDFCPVFQRLDEYTKAGGQVDALFYLSDCCGAFPEKKPAYPVYFVAKKSWLEEWSPEVPEWVNLILLEGKE